jgi:glycosyltransferase involved in cell wall biosynthesis
MPAAELNELYNAADLYAAPYLAEAFSLTPLEALRAGLPVMVPRGGGAAEYLTDLAHDDDDDDAGEEAGAGAASQRFIRFLAAAEETWADGTQVNRVEHADVARVIAEAVGAKRDAAGSKGDGDVRPRKAAAARLAARIDARWSWSAVAERLMGTFQQLAAAEKPEQGGRAAAAGGDDGEL